MPDIIEQLLEEHRGIERLLVVLEDESGVFAQQERPDYEVIQAAIDYFQDYPHCCHHPKEDMIFEKLKARDPAAAARIGDIDSEHRAEAERLQRVADVVRSILLDQDVSRRAFDEIMRDFIQQERAHMKQEEAALFPAAAKALRADDWADISSAWDDRKESLFNVALEERCDSLRSRILQWSAENNEHRTHRSPRPE